MQAKESVSTQDSKIFPTKKGDQKSIIFTEATEKKYNVIFLQRVLTPKGMATVIGESVEEKQLWFWLDDDIGISYWDDITGDIFATDGFCRPYAYARFEQHSPYNSLDWPSKLRYKIYELFNVSIDQLIGSHFGGILKKQSVIEELKKFNSEILEDDKFEISLSKYFLESPSDFLPLIQQLIYAYTEFDRDQQRISNVVSNHPQGLSTSTVVKEIESNVEELKKLKSELQNNPFAEKSVNLANKNIQALEAEKRALKSVAESKAVLKEINTIYSPAPEKIQAVLQYFFNFLLNITYPKVWGKKSQYQEIMKLVGEFMYDHAFTLFQEDEALRYVYPLLFLVIAGVKDNDQCKQSCYARLIENKLSIGLNLESYCQDFPAKFIKLYDLLMDEKNDFWIHLKSGLDNNNTECLFEYAKLSLFSVLANRKNNNNIREKDEMLLVEVKQILIDLHLTHSHQEAGSLLDKYFSDDFTYLVKKAIQILKVDGKSQAGTILLQKANHQFTNYVKSRYTEEEIAFAFHLYQDSLTTKSQTDAKKALSILYNAGKTDSNALEYLKKIGHQNGEAAYLVGKITIENHKDLSTGLGIMRTAAVLGYASAYYALYKYQDDKVNLFMAANKGDTEAILELTQLAQSVNEVSLKNPLLNYHLRLEANYVLGLMHQNGKGVPQDTDKAKRYFMNAYHAMPEAKIALLRLCLTNAKEEEAFIIQLFKQVLVEKKVLEQAIALGNEMLKSENVTAEIRYEAAMNLAKLFYFTRDTIQNFKKAAELADFCFTLKPTNFEFIQVAFFNSEFRKHLSNDTVLKLFPTLYSQIPQSFTEAKLVEIVSDFLSRKDEDLNLLLLTCSDLRQHLTGGEITFLLHVCVNSKSINLKSVCGIIMDAIKKQENTKVYLEWLSKNETVLLAVLKHTNTLDELTDVEWQQFVKSKPVQKLINKDKFLSNNNSKEGFFQKKKEFTKQLGDCYAKTKMEIFNTLFLHILALKESNKKGDSGKEIALEQLKNKMNNVNNMFDLECFVQSLAEVDDFFNQFIPKKGSGMGS